MADIGNFTEQVRSAKRGETVRDSIIKALRTMHEFGIRAGALQGRKPNEFATKTQVVRAFLITQKMDDKDIYISEIKKDSNKAVKSKAVYESYVSINKKFDELLGE